MDKDVAFVRPVRASAERRTRHTLTAAAACVLACVVVAVMVVAPKQAGKSVLSVTFSDGPDPDAPSPRDLWNSGHAVMIEREGSPLQQGQEPVDSSMQLKQQQLLNSYDDYSEGGYQVKRLERVMDKIQKAEQEFSEVDAEREAVMKQVEELTRRADGLEMQAKDIKDDLTRYSEQQARLVMQLHPHIDLGEEEHPVAGEQPVEEVRAEPAEVRPAGEVPSAEATAVPAEVVAPAEAAAAPVAEGAAEAPEPAAAATEPAAAATPEETPAGEPEATPAGEEAVAPAAEGGEHPEEHAEEPAPEETPAA